MESCHHHDTYTSDKCFSHVSNAMDENSAESDSILMTLSTKQRDQLLKFRERVKDVLQLYHNDYWLLRFLIARNFNLRKSEHMFRKNITWREENKVSTICEDFHISEVLQKYTCGGLIGYAKDGRPVFLDPSGNIDFKGLLHSVTAADLTKMYIKQLEMLQNEVLSQTEKLHRQIDGIYYIVDLEKLSHHHLWKPGVQLFTSVVQLCEHNYPELLHHVMVVRPPKLFPLAYSIIKPFLSDATRNKVHIYREDFAKDLLQYVDADLLPQHWGGTRLEDGNPMCPNIIRQGGRVPKEYYMTGQDLCVDASQMTCKEIARGGTLQLTFQPSQCDSVLRYEFRTKDYDLGFGVKRLSDNGHKTVIIKTERHNCHLVPQTGQLILEEPGTYVVKFDNSYSWTRVKRLRYWIELMEPEQDGDAKLQGMDDAEDEIDEFVEALDS